MATNYLLKAGHTLAATVNEGRAHIRTADGVEGVFTRSSASFGPYLVDRAFLVDGDCAVVLAPVLTASNSLAFEHYGAPANAARAAIDINPTGDDNGLTFTARAYGAEGNGITVAYLDPSANSADLAVSVYRQAISVSLATDGDGLITSTASDILAAIEADPAANGLVSAALVDGDDGSGVVAAEAATALENGAGTGVGAVKPGGLLFDTENTAAYINTGTQAAPVWTAMTDASVFGPATSTLNGLAAVFRYGAGAPVDYTDGTPPATGEGVAPKGALYSDTTNGFVYRNSGTQAEPIWTKLADDAP
jgi:hypothetical protein